MEARKWIAVENHSEEYLETSRFRFEPENVTVPLPPKKRPANGQANLFSIFAPRPVRR